MDSLRTLRPRLASIIGASILPLTMAAQVSIYEFSQSVQTYTDITEADGGYSLGVPTFDPPLHNLRAFVDPEEPNGVITNGGYLNPAIGPGYPIGFDFTYNGDVFDVIGVAHGGWISFGKSSDGDEAVVCFTSDHPAGRPLSHSYWATPLDHDYQRNRIAGWGNTALRMQNNSLLIPPGPVSSLRIATLGTAPNRVCVIQWKDFRHNYSTDGNKINFQIRLNESDNSVEVRYGPMIWASIGAYVQVGLGGRTNEDFNNRVVVYEEPTFVYDWNVTTAGTENDDDCYAITYMPGQPDGSGVPPVSGRAWKWTPPACPPPAWPLEFSAVSFQGAVASWPSTGSEAYDYFVSTENSITGPEVASGTVTDPEVAIEGLEAKTTYYVFVRSYCDGEPGGWGAGTRLNSLGGGYLACPGEPMEETYCSEQFSVMEWQYISEDGFSPVKIEFQGGFVGSAFGESFALWDGPAPVGNPDWVAPSGDLGGQQFTASTGQLFIRLTTDAGACTAQPWYLPLRWRAGCKNCTDPLATFSLVEDCDNQQYSVEVDVFSLGSTTTATLENSLGVAPTALSTTGMHVAGPFPAGTAVVVTLQNAENAMCYRASTQLINLPCAVLDCGPTNVLECYDDNAWFQRAYQAEAGQEIGIRFRQGSVGLGDDVRIYNGLDPEVAPFTTLNGPLANVIHLSGGASTDRTLVLELISDLENSCADAGPLYGAPEAWDYVVECFDGCTQPQATFVSTCLGQTQYEVTVTLSALGSAGSVTITNNGGFPNITATAPGVHTIGPVASGTSIRIEVEGASELCSWTSPVQYLNCTGVGLDESPALETLRVFPNPTSGIVRVIIPEHIRTGARLQVFDVAGRSVMQDVLLATGEAVLDLSHLTNGLYTVTLGDGNQLAVARVSLTH